MTIFDDTPALRQLLTSYYHEDWTMDRRNYAEMVREFAASEPPQVVAAARAEVRALLARPLADEVLEEGLIAVGCYFYEPDARVPARAWLSGVAGILDADA